MSKKILVIEDDHTQNDVLSNFLKHESYEVLSAYSLEDARLLLDDSVHLIILDVMLPDGNGLDYLKEIRLFYSIPVIVLTALDDEFTQIQTFDLKADEYVDKPVSPVVMTKRVKALLDRVYPDSDTVKIQDYRFNFKRYTACDQEQNDLKLTTKEIAIIKLLYEKNNIAVSRQEIIDTVWGYEYVLEDRIIDTHIKNIRKKLGTDIIITIKGIGYRLNV